MKQVKAYLDESLQHFNENEKAGHLEGSGQE